MFKLYYPSESARWDNHLSFINWSEYWKTLGYLSNPNIHKYYKENNEFFYNRVFDVHIKYEYNSHTNSHSDTGRLCYYGNAHNEVWFASNFSNFYSIKSGSPGGNMFFRINRKEFMETLEYDLGFIKVIEPGARDSIIIPEESDVALSYAMAHLNFDLEAWNVGWDLGNV